MNFPQFLVIFMFTIIYAVGISQHGKLRPEDKKPTEGGVILTMFFIHGLYFWGGFYKTFGWPQISLIVLDALVVAHFIVRDKDKPLRYNGFRSTLDAIITFSCLYAGGFFTHGVPQ